MNSSIDSPTRDGVVTPLPPLPEAAMLLEVSWEVCSQVGGIYTVLRTKAPATVRRWGEQYALVGPYREHSARVEVEPHAPPDWLRVPLFELEGLGIRAHVGNWLISGRPMVILLDTAGLRRRLGELKYFLWKDNGIGSCDGDWEFDDNVLFGFAVVELITALRRHLPARPLLVHCHEWQAGVCLPVMRHRGVDVATVFTTHATMVGRNLCAANDNIYDHLDQIDAGRAAATCGYAHRHSVEGAAAQAADVFTTVSGITALEAERFLGRRPDVLVPNGINVARFAAPHEFQVLHREAKERIHQFVIAHFFPSYTFDLDRTLYVFTAGRYEYRNKGLDVFIESLARLNERMKAEGSPATVVAFIVTKAPVRGLNVDTLNRQAMFNELRDACDEIKDEVGYRLLRIIATGRMPRFDELIDQYAQVRLKRMMFSWRSSPPPAIVTHDLVDDVNDPVLCHLRHRGLWNLEHDRVKVVFHPDFISVASPLFGMDYDQFVRGCHMGVFPSYYEPWGYTPLECVVSGLPSITSDLSGFGDYLIQNFPNHDEVGMYVARRRGQPFEVTVQQVTEWLHQITLMNRRERIALRNRTEQHAEHFDWTNLGRHYWTAHALALERHYAGRATMPPDPDAPASAAQPPRLPGAATDGPPLRRRESKRRTAKSKD